MLCSVGQARTRLDSVRHFLVVYIKSTGDCESMVHAKTKLPGCLGSPTCSQLPSPLVLGFGKLLHMFQETIASQNDVGGRTRTFVFSVYLLCLSCAGKAVMGVPSSPKRGEGTAALVKIAFQPVGQTV